MKPADARFVAALVPWLTSARPGPLVEDPGAELADVLELHDHQTRRTYARLVLSHREAQVTTWN
ncbi:MAG: hypothetical protein CMN30_08310 [Sandaracinus sp.]|nr:hypothetical protein [Sandaracinus sp.]